MAKLELGDETLRTKNANYFSPPVARHSTGGLF